MINNNNPSPTDLLKSYLSQKENLPKTSVWHASTLSLSRNLSFFKFPENLSKDQKVEVLQLIFAQLQSIETLSEAILLKTTDIPLLTKEFLLEHFLFPYDIHNRSEGEGFVINRTGNFLAIINSDDHLVLHYIDFENEPEKALEKLILIDNELHQHLAFAFSSDFGFLTSNPSRCGTALQVHCYFHIPALIYSKAFSTLIDEESELNINGIIPSIKDFPGHMVTLSNKCTLGLTEEHILSNLRIWGTKLISAEHLARKNISLSKDHTDLKNQVLRALGLLSHSCSLDLKETLDALSLILLGLEFQWISDPTNTMSWAKLFWLTRRAHLSLKYMDQHEINLQQEAIAQLRASHFKELAVNISSTN